jgi:hypothetical protein
VEIGNYLNKFQISNFKNGGLAQLARAPALHAGGHRFDSDILHYKRRSWQFAIGNKERSSYNIDDDMKRLRRTGWFKSIIMTTVIETM